VFRFTPGMRRLTIAKTPHLAAQFTRQRSDLQLERQGSPHDRVVEVGGTGIRHGKHGSAMGSDL
jgi:hypothetical protein